MKQFLSSHVIWSAVFYLFLSGGLSLRAEPRLALVIGNNDYRHAERLNNCVNDARAVGARLRSLGWHTSEYVDAEASALRRAMSGFVEGIPEGAVALVYYAGHGAEVRGENYLLAVDARLDGEREMKDGSVALSEILTLLGRSKCGPKAVILDACRNNPLAEASWAVGASGAGLAEVPEEERPTGSLLVFSTAPGKVAPDGAGDHSPFTASLIEALQPGATLMSAVARVAKKTRESEPWIRFDASAKTFAAFSELHLGPRSGDPDRVTLNASAVRSMVDLLEARQGFRLGLEVSRKMPPQADWEDATDVRSGNLDLVAGERIRFKVESEQDAHLLLLDFMSDGTVEVLFPSGGNGETMVQTRRPEVIPPDEREIEVCEPYGTDVVVAIACAAKEGEPMPAPMRGLLEKARQAGGLTRSLAGECLKEIWAGAEARRWAVSRLTLTTRAAKPAPENPALSP